MLFDVDISEISDVQKKTLLGVDPNEQGEYVMVGKKFKKFMPLTYSEGKRILDSAQDLFSGLGNAKTESEFKKVIFDNFIPAVLKTLGIDGEITIKQMIHLAYVIWKTSFDMGDVDGEMSKNLKSLWSRMFPEATAMGSSMLKDSSNDSTLTGMQLPMYANSTVTSQVMSGDVGE